MNTLRDFIQSRGAQLIARYLGMIILAWVGHKLNTDDNAAALGELIAAVALFTFDHLNHKKRATKPAK